MKIAEAMHRKVQWVSADTPVREVATIMLKDDVGAIPVGKDDRLIGMITDRDIAMRVVAAGCDARTMTAEEAMTPGIIFCQTGQSVDEAIDLMDARQIRRLPVLNEKKRMVGMLSLGDVSHAVDRGRSGELLHAVSAHHA